MKEHKPTPLKILKDTISFDLDKQAEEDAFSHSTYADIILRILTAKDNEPPLTIGLFGSWGIGKSFVVRELFEKIKGQQTQFLPILFNAWQYSGDSFRRQFLLEVAQQVYKGHPEETKQLARLEQLNYTEVLKEGREYGFWQTLKELPWIKVRFRQSGLVRGFIALIILIIGSGIALITRSASPFWMSLVMAAITFVLRFKFEDLILIQETPVYDPQMVFPEQFQKEFHNIVRKGGPIGDKTAVIAIDDIDRCHPPTVRDILISIKTFLGHNNCFIIVPCDDRSVVRVFSDPSQEKGYTDESLRKYFDIGVRMAPIMSADLIDFANQVTDKTGIPAEVVQIGVFGNCRDGRKIKHFLNTYQIKRDLAQARSIPFTPESLAKVIVIEDQYPDLFDKIVEEPEIYHALDRIALSSAPPNEATTKLAEIGLKVPIDDYICLKAFLERTRYVAMEDIRFLFSLKATNPEARIPNGTELRDAIVSCDKEKMEVLLKDIPADAGKDFGQILSHIISTAKGSFLRNAIAMALEICGDGSLIPDVIRISISRRVCENLCLGNGPPLLSLEPQLVMACADKDVNKQCLIKRYNDELKAIEEMPANLAHILNTIFPQTAKVKMLSTTVNGKLEKWPITKAYLEQVRLLETQECAGIPNSAVIEKIASGITPDISKDAYQMNPLRKDIILRNWDDCIIPTVAQKVTELLTEAHREGEEWTGEKIQLCREILLARHEVTHIDTPALWNATKQACSSAKQSTQKLEAHNLALVFAIHSTLPTSSNDARAFVKSQWQSFNNEESITALKQIRNYSEKERQEVEQDIMIQELSLCTGRVNNPDDRVFDRVAFCVRERKFLGIDKVEQLVFSALDTPSAPFVKWTERIPDYAKKLSKGFATRTSEHCLALIPTEGDKVKRDALFTLFAAMIQLTEAAKKDALLRKYFDLCRHDNVNVRMSALSALREIDGVMDPHDFKLNINSLLCSAVRNLSPDKLPEWHDSLQALLRYKHLFGDAEWRDVAALGKHALSHSNATIAQNGIPLLAALDRIPSDQEEDIVHLLVRWGRGTEEKMSSVCKDILNRLSKTGIHSEEARQAIAQFESEASNDS